MHNFVALRGLELVFVVAGVERHQEMALQMLWRGKQSFLQNLTVKDNM